MKAAQHAAAIAVTEGFRTLKQEIKTAVYVSPFSNMSIMLDTSLTHKQRAGSDGQTDGWACQPTQQANYLPSWKALLMCQITLSIPDKQTHFECLHIPVSDGSFIHDMDSNSGCHTKQCGAKCNHCEDVRSCTVIGHQMNKRRAWWQEHRRSREYKARLNSS